MPDKGVRCEGDETEEKKEEVNAAKLYAWLDRPDRTSEIRAEEKSIEESQALEKEQRKEELLEKVAEVVSDSEWFDRIRTFIRSAVANSETQIVQMLLVREKDDIWSFEAIIGMEKPKGVNYIKVDFGNEP